jgi:hypothetical protein
MSLERLSIIEFGAYTTKLNEIVKFLKSFKNNA